CFTALAFNPQGASLAVVSREPAPFDDEALYWTRILTPHTVQLHDATTGKQLLKPLEFPSRVSVAFSPDGKRLATAYRLSPTDDDWRGDVKIWDVASGKVLIHIPGQPDFQAHLRFSPDGVLLAGVSYRTGAVKVWDAATGDLRFALASNGHCFMS